MSKYYSNNKKNKQGTSIHTCKQCSESFFSLQSLLSHKNIYHRPIDVQYDLSEYDEYDTDDEYDSKNHTCTACTFHCPQDYSNASRLYSLNGNSSKKIKSSLSNQPSDKLKNTRPKKRVKFNDSTSNNQTGNILNFKRKLDELTELFEKMK